MNRMVVGADELDRVVDEMGVGGPGDDPSQTVKQIQILGFSSEGPFREWPVGLTPALAVAPQTTKSLTTTGDRRAFLQNLELFTGGDADAEVFPVTSANDQFAVTNITLNGVRSFLGSGYMTGRAFTAAWGYKPSYYGMIDSNGPVVVDVFNLGDHDTIDISGTFYAAVAGHG
jgi:hypothetical protein